ncbi:hypothetical protein, partial [Mesorhizobium sp. M1C.F.Ca.ET.195.01.1.1]|uniref:hypothetical protein n=1 Tax=Mesorhizobium sp. M1C.F.Ca.ET.195.01.1.1 TaxID=2563927 RepID=UPI001AEEF31A
MAPDVAESGAGGRARPGKGWTPWEHGPAAVWWDARKLHFALLNVSVLLSGSELVAIEHWDFRGDRWCMRKPP